MKASKFLDKIVDLTENQLVKKGISDDYIIYWDVDDDKHPIMRIIYPDEHTAIYDLEEYRIRQNEEDISVKDIFKRDIKDRIFNDIEQYNELGQSLDVNGPIQDTPAVEPYLSFEYFCETIEQRLNDEYGFLPFDTVNSYRYTTIETYNRDNNEMQYSTILHKGNEYYCMLEPIYHIYQNMYDNRGNIENVFNHVYNEFIQRNNNSLTSIPMQFNPSCFNFEDVKDKIFPQFSSVHEECQHPDILYKKDEDTGLVMYYEIALCDEMGFKMTITNEYAFNKEDVYNHAYENIQNQKDDFYFCKDLIAMLPLNDNSDPFYIIQASGNYCYGKGAINILNKEVLDTLKKNLGEDFCIIPASVNECFAVSKETVKDKDLTRLLQCCNTDTNMCLPNEVLSHQLLSFDFENNKLKLFEEKELELDFDDLE